MTTLGINRTKLKTAIKKNNTIYLQLKGINVTNLAHDCDIKQQTQKKKHISETCKYAFS